MYIVQRPNLCLQLSHNSATSDFSLTNMLRFSFIVFHVFSLVVENSKGAVPSLIFDTDMDFDVDDVGALCLVHSLQVVHLLYLTFRSKWDDYC